MSSASIRAGAAYIELTLRDRVSKPLHNASVALKDFGNAVAWQGAKITAMGAAITAPLAAMAHSFATSALEAGKFANKRDAAAVFNYVSALQRLSHAFGELRDAVGSAVLPLMSRWPNTLARIVTQAAAWVRANRGLVQTIARVGSALVAAGAIIGFVGKGIAGLGSVFGVLAGVASTVATAVGLLGTALALLLTPMGLLIGAAVAFGGVFLQQTGLAADGLGWLQEKFVELKDEALQSWSAIGDALATGDIKLAAEIVWLHLKMEWQRGVNALNQMWISAKDFFLTTWSNASYAVAGFFVDSWALIETGWVETVDFLRDSWAIFTNVLQKTWNTTIGFVQKAWVRLKALFDEDINVDAEVNRINSETSAANTEADGKRDSGIIARDERRKERKTEIENERRRTQSALGDMQAADDTDRQQAFEQQRKASEQAVVQAKTDLTAARTKAREQKRAQDTRAPEEDIPVVLDQEQKKLDSKGTFNAMAVRGLGSDSLAERTAKGVEKGADLLKNIKDQINRGKAVFA
jgi:hypothetical protein